MKDLRTFEIDIIALKLGSHSFTFKLDNEFFAYVKEHLNGFIEKGDCNAEVILEKNEQLIRATLIIDGTVELVCDRSLDEFDYEVDVEDTILYKYSEEERELTEEIVLITRRTPSINVGELLYEFLMLDIPMKKLHPRFWEEEDGYSDDDSDEYTESGDLDNLDDEESDKKAKKINFIYSSETDKKSEDKSGDKKDSKNKTTPSSEDEKIDPRWSILKNLKNNQN
ncbi:YceD family protein [Bernardetia sp. Wsw4-3y2]|uniref:YceD family protein n=1 Tax=unclassified Bernardetia TaxID=2647129 RepID=UPI0030D0EFEB